MVRFADHPASAWVLGILALGLAAIGAKPYAGSWNDGCRLAAVESLLDRGTLAIDDSIFCHPPKRLIDAGRPPYDPARPDLLAVGTLDKLYVRGHFHSDKPAVVSILMAGIYWPLMALGVPGPSERPDIFCYSMTLLTSGLGYAIAVGCLWVLGRRVGLEPRWRLFWLAAFALSTFALTYTQYVNAHAMELGVAAAICLLLADLGERPHFGSLRLIALGSLAGFGFNLDFGSGPPLAACLFMIVAWRTRRLLPILTFSLAMLPWVAAALGINYAIAGGIKPINMYPEHYRFPGSPFTEENLTGFFRHEPLNQVLYAAGMLFGKKGFANHNLPLLLVLFAGIRVLRRPFATRPEMLALAGWFAMTWLLYAVLSNNMGGACCSMRWLMPFLAPGFWLLARLLRDRPEYRSDFAVVAGWGFALAALMWWKGPWTGRMVPLLWPIVGLALIHWGLVIGRRWKNRVRETKELAADFWIGERRAA
ncbi:MAG TPA: hypothetical protein VGI99_05890 [Gemmataceae bacterium]|jgi:hypothetical protein